MSLPLDSNEAEKLAAQVFELRETRDGAYGDFVFLIPPPYTVSLDARQQGGSVELLTLGEFCSRIVGLEHPDEVAERRDALASQAASFLGNLITADLEVKRAR